LADNPRFVEGVMDIAGKRCFSLGMVARFWARNMGSRFLDVLIGQVLYLEAHAFGISATCIGCYFNGAGYFFSLSTCSQLCALSYWNQSPMCTISLFVNNPYVDLDQDCNAHCYNSTGKDFFYCFHLHV